MEKLPDENTEERTLLYCVFKAMIIIISLPLILVFFLASRWLKGYYDMWDNDE